MPKTETSASGFLLDLVPRKIRAAFETLEGLKYPLNDQQSLMSAVEGDLGLLRELEATDFPLASPVNAFEKLRDRLRLFPLAPAPDLPEDQIEGRSVAEIYEEAFGPMCAQKALEAYQKALDGGWSKYRALVIGHEEGHRCAGAP